MSAGSRQARRFALVSITVAIVVITLASSRSHYKPAAHPPNDMPANSRWLTTGRDPDTNAKIGLWAACWMSPGHTADHCRITDQTGSAQFDGDMLPLKARQPAVAQDLRLAAIDPATLWVRGVHSDLPVPMLLLADGTRLVPASDLEGLQNRMARGEWQDGLRGSFHSLPPQ
ncbi:MAG TPA: hypothetical protein VNU94_07425 [Acidobacteriaceae bacterium]|jgi:hypothetical protein|nr:hypothetical protein [Acidobacteriaceae bacterium]